MILVGRLFDRELGLVMMNIEDKEHKEIEPSLNILSSRVRQKQGKLRIELVAFKRA